MEYIKTQCRKCGYELEFPEKTESVICGSCGEINRFSRLNSLLRKHSDPSLEIKWEEKTSGTTAQSGKSKENRTTPALKKPPVISLPDKSENNNPLPEDDDGYPEQGSATKIMTLIFIIAPFIAIAVERFKLPSYVAVIVIAAVILLVFLLKKRS